jgi:hypothetical protein
MKGIRTFALAAALLGGLIVASGQASAMMPNGLSALTQEQASDVQDVRWVCGPFRCFWRPNRFGRRAFGFYRPPVYRPRPFLWGPRWRWWWR